MLIFNTVIVKNFLRTIPVIAFILLFQLSPVSAASPNFSLYPNGGTVVNKDNGFVVDVMIDTAGQAVSSARFAISFDPAYIRLKKAERNNTLFAQWPEDESTIDNTNGLVVLTGFTQSGSATLYTTEGSADVMARLSFEVVKQGSTTLNWEYTGSDDTFKTVILKDGSPPQNILNTKPSSATFKIGKSIITNPNTGIDLNKYVLAFGGVLILIGGFLVFTKSTRVRKKKGTIVIYE